MNYNSFVQCDICETKVNLRTQIGFYDIPFHFQCPSCKTTISGKINLDPYRLNIENAHSVEMEEEGFYSVELSAEFPTRKMIYKRTTDFELTPFIRNMQFFDRAENTNLLTKEAMKFADFTNSEWGIFKQNFELYWNSQQAVLHPRLEIAVKKYSLPLSSIKNDLDSMMAIHQLLLMTTGISSVVNRNSLTEYSKIGNLIVGAEEHHAQIFDYIENQHLSFNAIERKSIKLIDLFSKVYEQLIPIVALKNANSLDNVDREEFGIMTANFDELSDFYAKSYEWILENISIVVALNNIFTRNDFRKCVDGNYDKFLKSTKGNRLKNGYIVDSEPFSKPIISLDNKIRNAIQHFDCDIDYTSQKITFNDRNKNVEIFLIDFANLCLENFSIIFYIVELIYNLRKLEFIKKGIIPSFALGSFPIADSQKSIRKIGRNELCPCGSGKKYKKCCIDK